MFKIRGKGKDSIAKCCLAIVLYIPDATQLVFRKNWKTTPSRGVLFDFVRKFIRY